MAFDSYAPCPGGRDKKIRFCCPDLFKELEQIDSMMNNRQTAAALTLIETLEPNHADCACLKAAKCEALRNSGRWEEFFDTARKFAEAEPDNPRAISELTLAAAVSGNESDALLNLIDGIEKTEPGKMHSSLLLPAFLTASKLYGAGKIFPAVALCKLLQAYQPNNHDVAELLNQIYSSRDVPLILKEMSFDRVAPSDAPIKSQYAEAVLRLATGQWRKGRELLEAMSLQSGVWSGVWRALALVRFWLDDEEGGIDALKKFADAPETNEEDAVDAETLLFFLNEYADDTVDITRSVWPISDEDKTLEAFLSSSEFVNVPFDPRQYGDADHPAPNHIFNVIDRPFPANESAATLENTPVLLGTLMLFGRQTDRSARIESHVSQIDRPAFNAQLQKIAGAWLGAEVQTETILRAPWDITVMRREFQFKPNAEITVESLTALYREHLERNFVPAWLERPSGAFDDKTPTAASAEPRYARRLAGSVAALGLEGNESTADFLCDLLRQKLALPRPQTLVPPADDESALAFFRELPIWRWRRVDLSGVSAKVIGQLLTVARVFSETVLIEAFAEKALSFPAVRDEVPARLTAYEVMIEKATLAGDANRALELTETASSEARQFEFSDGRFHLRKAILELSLNRPEEFRKTVEHLAHEHRNEPEIMAALQNMLVQLGILSPDGSPREMPRAASAPFEAPAEEAPRGSGLWTPGSDEPSGGGTGKLWTLD